MAKILISITLFFVSSFSKAGLFTEVIKEKSKTQEAYRQLVQKAMPYNLKLQENLESLDIKLSNEYLDIVLFTTEKKYIPLFKKNDLCRFAELLQNDIARPNEKVIFDITINKKRTKAFFKFEDAVNYLINKKECQESKNSSLSFKKENLKKTFESLGITRINNSRQCNTIFQRLTTSKYLPYLCGLSQFFKKSAVATLRIDQGENLAFETRSKLLGQIKRSQMYKDEMTPMQIGVIDNFCNNLNDQKNFCSSYTIKNIWKGAVIGEYSLDKIKYRCQQIDGKMPSNAKSFRQCAETLTKKPDTCRYMGSMEYLASFPKPDCNENSNSLANGNLESGYQDCPGVVENHLFVHGSRIINHKKKLFTKFAENNCKDISEKVFGQAAYEMDPDNWPLRICYPDPLDTKFIDVCLTMDGVDHCTKYQENVSEENSKSLIFNAQKLIAKHLNGETPVKCIETEENKTDKFLYTKGTECLITFNQKNCDELNCPRKYYFNRKQIPFLYNKKRELTCIPYIPGDDKTLKNSETRVLNKIIARLRPTGDDSNCQIIPKKSYRPLLLKYQIGCFVLKNESCSQKSCAPEIFFNNRPIRSIKYEGDFLQNILFLSTEDKGITTDKTIEQFLEIYPSKIMSLTNLKFFLRNKGAIASAVGCLEDIYPEKFPRQRLNQCTPNQFIIDGYISKGLRDYIIVRTTLDEIGAPKQILWNKLFNSLKMFQSIHPRKEWILYGIN